MPIPITNAFGSNLHGRKSLLALAQIDHLYPKYRAFLLRMVEDHYSIALLENALIQESLKFGDAEAAIRVAWDSAYVGRVKPPALTEDAFCFGKALLQSLRELWDRPPFDHPDFIVYGARRHGYIGMTLAVEVIHREPLPPKYSHSPRTARAGC